MTIINTLSKDYNQYLEYCLDVLNTKTDIIHLDYSKGETDFTRLIFVEKQDFTKQHALAMLTTRSFMYTEEWNDVKNYKKEDIERWIPLLKKQYEGAVYSDNMTVADFQNSFPFQRLPMKKTLKNSEHNAQIIDFLTFKRINPLFHERLMAVSKTTFAGLQEEFYIETSHHFVLFNWFTTA
jgi:hypothetical protein